MTKKARIRIIALAVALAAIITAIPFVIISNSSPECSYYEIRTEDTKGSDGIRIAQISDLHNAEFGKDNEKLLSLLEKSDPDIIAITGDMIDSRKTDVDTALRFAEKAVMIAPCYYVSGNHEARTDEYERLKSGLTKIGVKVLENRSEDIKLGEKTVRIIGMSDPAFSKSREISEAQAADNLLSQLKTEEPVFTLLLSHRPELFELYVKHGFDLVLSGHAHGGQWRLPFIGGLIAPGQGLFPKYDAGLFSENGTNMIVSRGIGNSLFPFRLGNRPQIVVVDII